MTKQPIRYVWCAEDEKYGLQAVYATKRAADKDWVGSNAPQRWPSGYGGAIFKRKVHQ